MRIYGGLMEFNGIYPLVMTNGSPWDFDGPNRNRWFTVLKNGGSFHGKLLNNQMVFSVIIVFCITICFFLLLPDFNLLNISGIAL